MTSPILFSQYESNDCQKVVQLADGRAARRWFTTSAADLNQCLFDEAVDAPLPCKITAVMNTPTNVHLIKGPMERLRVQVSWVMNVAILVSGPCLKSSPSSGRLQLLIMH